MAETEGGGGARRGGNTPSCPTGRGVNSIMSHMRDAIRGKIVKMNNFKKSLMVYVFLNIFWGKK